MNVDYVPVADLTTAAEMIARQKEIRRRQEEAGRKLKALQPKPVRVEAEQEPAETAPPPAAFPQGASDLRDALARLPRSIIRRVAAQHGVTFDDIVGEDRSVQFVTARHAAIRAVKEAHPTFSIKRLGRIFGGRDPSSIRNALGLNPRPRSANRQKSGVFCAEAPSPMQIIEDTSRKYSVFPHDVIGRCYVEAVSLARHEAVANIRAAHPEMTARQIGNLFDGRSDNFVANCLAYMRRAA